MCHRGRVNRAPVSKAHQDVLRQLATDLHASVEDFASLLLRMFNDYRGRKLGVSIADVTDNIFERWCADSGTIWLIPRK